MYEFIRGKIHSMLPGTVILEAAGVGYRIQVPLSTSGKLKGGEALLLVHHTINAEQGEEKLFGFLTDRERDLFRALITVKGIGPATAITVMCAADPDDIIRLVAAADVAALKKFKGIGPKTAERMVTELRDDFSKWTVGGTTASVRSAKIPGAKGNDAVLALLSLGYPQSKSEAAVAKAAVKLGEKASTEEIVRQALQLV
ncbi:MAG: Holliday junction branch migration protein RuvA [Planctomycetes bacterium]|nr:Holliday junction branch migration protein RuvA [Planctomycetota bacterium]